MKFKIYIAGPFVGVLLSSCYQNNNSELINIGEFESLMVRKRAITVYLPPSYQIGNKFYPVLYMHDGQMLFDSTTTWNGQDWGVDETMDRLIRENEIQESIVVGIFNGDELRHSEYFPQKPFESLDPLIQDSLYQLNRSVDQPLFSAPIQSDNYLKFLVGELKPFIDENFRTIPDQVNTFIAGSSMGGLISMYAVCEYPDTFYGAICMSTHWPGIFTTENNPIPEAFYKYLTDNLPDPENHKFYFDYGTETLDALYEPFQLEVDKIMLKAGYDDKNFLSKKFEGQEHSERDWNRRLHIPLTFNLAKEKQ